MISPAFGVANFYQSQCQGCPGGRTDKPIRQLMKELKVNA